MLHSWEIDSQEYYTLGRLTRQSIMPWREGLIGKKFFFFLGGGDIIPQEDGLVGVLHSGEIDSQEYYTLGRLTHQSIIPLRD